MTRSHWVSVIAVALAACAQPQSASCREWVACADALAAANGSTSSASRDWGPGASCWLTPSGAESCARECIEQLHEVRAMGASLPLECNPIMPEAPAPYDPLPPPGPCSAPRVLAGSAVGRPELAPVDWGGDGILDFVVADAEGSVLQLYRGDGSGRFQAISSPGFGRGSHDLRVEDVDHDGVPDALVLQDESVVTYRGAADGTFTYAVGTPGFHGSGATWADFDGDGETDVFVPGMALGGLALHARGHGDGTFGPVDRLMPGRQISIAQPADLDEDGDLDVLTWFVDETLGIARNDGAGAFTFETVGGTSLLAAQEIEAGDLDGDGHEDVVLLGVEEITGDAPFVVAVLFGDGTGALGGEQILRLADGAYLVRAEDVDDDGHDDVVIATPAGVVFHRIEAGRVVSAPIATPIAEPIGDYFRADVDGDAQPDLVTTPQRGPTLWSAVTIYFACRGPRG